MSGAVWSGKRRPPLEDRRLSRINFKLIIEAPLLDEFKRQARREGKTLSWWLCDVATDRLRHLASAGHSGLAKWRLDR